MHKRVHAAPMTSSFSCCGQQLRCHARSQSLPVCKTARRQRACAHQSTLGHNRQIPVAAIGNEGFAEPERQREVNENAVSTSVSRSNDKAAVAGAAPRVAVEGDTVTLHFVCKDDQGNVLESSRETGEPATFEIGAGEIMGNQLFKAFDEAVRGLSVGDVTVMKAGGGEWNRELMFDVPIEHQEVQRLKERYKNVGGLAAGLVVELANGAPAVILDVKEDSVRIDANHMLAGKTLSFEMEVMAIERSGV